jgi:hypothetical protein
VKVKDATKDGRREVEILLGMACHPRVIGRISSKWEKDGMFDSPWCNLIGQWCVKYFKKYGKPPGRSLTNLFEAWANDRPRDKEYVSRVETFLVELSDRHVRLPKQINPDFLIDQAGELFNRVKYRKLKDAIEGNLELGKVEDNEKLLTKFRRVQIGAGSYVSILKDEEALMSAFQNKPESLVKYPKPLDRFFGRSLARENFVVFMGPMKRGKTFWIKDVCWRGVLQRKRVAFFQCGDLTQDQMMMRFAIRVAGTPLDPGKVKIPTSITLGSEGSEVEYKEKKFKKALTWLQAAKAFREVRENKVRSEEDYIRLSCHSIRSLTVSTIRDTLEGWAVEGWIPDVVGIDYLDILAPPSGYNQADHREAVNQNWQEVRRINQDFHCLIVSGTQANAASFTAKSLGMEHFSEDNRKFATVTGMIGLNQSSEEKDKQVVRLNWLVLREEKFNPLRFAYCAGCLEIGKPFVVAHY